MMMTMIFDSSDETVSRLRRLRAHFSRIRSSTRTCLFLTFRPNYKNEINVTLTGPGRKLNNIPRRQSFEEQQLAAVVK